MPEEIVDNSDLGDPEGMLQLSRVSLLPIILLTNAEQNWAILSETNKLDLIFSSIFPDDGSKAVQLNDQQADWEPTKLLHLHKGGQNSFYSSSPSSLPSSPYLIFVSNATNGVGVLFLSRCTFFHRERERDCFEQSLFRPNINAIFSIFVMMIIYPKYQMLHLM